MNREQAIEKAAQAVVNWNSDSSINSAVVMDALREALAMPKDAETVIEQVMAEYEREMCRWDDAEYLHKCADRYANVKEPSHLHCLAFALSRKLKAQQKADAERVALLADVDSWLEKNGGSASQAVILFTRIGAYLGGDA